MQDFDQQLLTEFRAEFEATGRGKFKDPKYPFEVSIEPTIHGHMITVIDTRRRWWGRTVMKTEEPTRPRSNIVDDGPVLTAMVSLEMAIESAFPLDYRP